MLEDHRPPGTLRRLTVNDGRDHLTPKGMVIEHANIDIK